MGRGHEILFLSLEDVVALGGADVSKAAVDIERGFHSFASGNVLQPHKTTLKVTQKGIEQASGLVNFLPSYVRLDDEEIYCCKGLGAMPANTERGMPRATGLITLYDSATKTPICVMDAQAISATRTGAVSMLAARKLVPIDVESVGLVGAGVNMKTQLLGLRAALPNLKSVKVTSRFQTKHLFAKAMSRKLEIEITAVDSVEEAVRDQRVIVTCLPNVSSPAVLSKHVPQHGVTVFNIGCYECEDQLVARMDRVIADIWEQGKHRGVQSHAVAVRNGLLDENRIEDLAPILVGQKKGRESENDNIFFCPTGLGFEDAVVAWRVYKQAVIEKRGSSLSLWKNSEWI